MKIDMRALQELCQNVSNILQGGNNLHVDQIHGYTAIQGETNKTAERIKYEEERDKHAILYIVVVLLFYSLGITVAIIMYLKREKEEIVEDKQFDDYMNFRADPDKWARYFRVQRMITYLNSVEKARDKRMSEEADSLLGKAETVRKEESVTTEAEIVTGEVAALLTMEEQTCDTQEPPTTDISSTQFPSRDVVIHMDIVDAQTDLPTEQTSFTMDNDCHSLSIDENNSVESIAEEIISMDDTDIHTATV